MTSKEIRKVFLDFFYEKGHKIVSSAPIVLKDDPTLMFTNAGMNQFKDYLLGDKVASDKKVADTQKCLRVSGKHNDLEDVGFDTYHHTMFEMLGNWSFGNIGQERGGYFKKEAIEWAWELLTKKYKIPTDRLYVSIFEGDISEGLSKDTESYDIWKNWIDENRILEFSKKDNFWEMGEVGPCGPSSEIHIDIRSEEERKQEDGKLLVNKDHPKVVEIWNLVFIQYNRIKDGTLKPLQDKYVDTGMGLERLCMALQGKESNYDTDLFQPLIKELEQIAHYKYGTDEKKDIAIRVVVDHLRAVAFAIADGQLPSNTGAGYVIRRILRRAVRYGYQFLGLEKPFVCTLVKPLTDLMGDAFPELKGQAGLIEKVIKEEESSFLKTLGNGIKRFEDALKSNNSGTFDGGVAFELYDTYGFPIDLTQLLAKEKSIQVDMEAFEKAMQQQKERARKASETDTSDWVEVNQGEGVEFTGYDSLEEKAKILKYRKVVAKEKTLYQVVLNRTPFYAESGGQVGDRGYFEIGEEKVEVLNTKKENDLIIHFLKKLPTNLDSNLTAHVSAAKRKKTEANHSATHLLHASLKSVLGDHVEQRGSLVDENHLRFDFSHFAKVTDEELSEIEQMVNLKIRSNISLDEKRDIAIDEAKKMGATALFGEKYGDTVRVITFDPSFSMELCGGTHVKSTGEIGYFKIISESSIAAGIRRIEAITAEEAEKYVNSKLNLLNKVETELKQPKDVIKAIIDLQEEGVKYRKKIERFEAGKVNHLANELKSKVQALDGINFIGEMIDLDSGDAVKNLAFRLRKELDNLYLVLGAKVNGKALITIALSDDLSKEGDLNAGTIIRDVSKLIQGGGGGQPFYATAGGKNPDGLQEAIERAKDYAIKIK